MLDIRAGLPVYKVFQFVYVCTSAVDITGLHWLIVDDGFFVEDRFQHMNKMVKLYGIVVSDVEDFIVFVVGFLYDSEYSFDDIVDIGKVSI